MVYREQIVLKVALLVSGVIFVIIGSLFAAPPVGEKTHKTAQASGRIMKELMEVYKSDSYKKGLFEVEPVDDNLYEWNVKLFFAHSKSPLREDLQRMKELGGEDHIMLRVSFDGEYPVAPPFIRVVYPTLDQGNISPFGTICMYHLSKQGWESNFTMEGILIMIIDLLETMDKRVDFDHKTRVQTHYTEEKARKAFPEQMRTHGWHVQRRNNLPTQD